MAVFYGHHGHEGFILEVKPKSKHNVIVITHNPNTTNAVMQWTLI